MSPSSQPKPVDTSPIIKKHNEKYHNSYLAMVERNQIPLSRALLCGIHLFNYIFPGGFASKFIRLQYRTGTSYSGSALYDIGIDDGYYVVHWVILLTFLRSFLMQWCFEPFASYFCNIHSRKAKVRFSEQSWSFVYYSFSFTYGAYLYYNSSYWLNFDQIFANWPHYQLGSLFKKYYLISMGFWLQQIFVLNIEERRKDHFQMFSHHIITCLLLTGSYYYYYNRIGHLILMIMDSVDIFLAAAKLLKYSGYNNACDFMFVFFMVSWVVLRHGLYNYLFYQSWHNAMSLMSNSECIPGQLQKRCWTPTILNSFFFLLGGLQIITMIWMYLISKVAYKVIMGKGAEDVRSDEDDLDNEEDSNIESDGHHSSSKRRDYPNIGSDINIK